MSKQKGRVRADNLSERLKAEILELHANGMKPGQIVKHLQNKVTYWQVYNTINPRVVEPVDDKAKPDNVVTAIPDDIDFDDFDSIDEYLESQLTVCARELQNRKLTINGRLNLLKQVQVISAKVKAGKIDAHLKNAKAKLIIAMMRRVKPDITNEELMTIYKEEAEKLKMEKKS